MLGRECGTQANHQMIKIKNTANANVSHFGVFPHSLMVILPRCKINVRLRLQSQLRKPVDGYKRREVKIFFGHTGFIVLW